MTDEIRERILKAALGLPGVIRAYAITGRQTERPGDVLAINGWWVAVDLHGPTRDQVLVPCPLSPEEIVDQYRKKLARSDLGAWPSCTEAREAAQGMGFNDYLNDRPYLNPFETAGESPLADPYRRGYEEARDLDELRRWGEIPG